MSDFVATAAKAGEFVLFDDRKAAAGGHFKALGIYPVEVSMRLESALERAGRSSDSVDPKAWDITKRLAAQAENGRTAATRYSWLLASADAFAHVAAPLSACKRGCSHCCHGPVGISAFEASAMGRVLGLTPAKAPSGGATVAAVGDDGEAQLAPCPFLKNNTCSIYEDRPLACRVRLNLDKDDLLCRTQAFSSHPVPLADDGPIRKAAMSVFGQHAVYADIRHWFGSRHFFDCQS